MTRLLIISDSHRNIQNIKSLLVKLSGGFDVCFHLGDTSSDMLPFNGSFKLFQVSGNIELYLTASGSMFPSEIFVELEGLMILAIHGHKFRVHSTLASLKSEAKKREADLVLFGHTHDKDYFTEEGITYFNPGAFKNSEYGLITLDKGIITEAKHLIFKE